MDICVPEVAQFLFCLLFLYELKIISTNGKFTGVNETALEVECGPAGGEEQTETDADGGRVNW